MASPTRGQDPQQLDLQRQAIEEAKLAYSRLPHGDAVFQQSVGGKEMLAEVLNMVERRCQSSQKKKSAKFLENLQKHTAWLQNIGDVVDVAVQTQAVIGCPVWAPIKLILKISNDYSKATKQVLDLLEIITECLPRLEIYAKLQSDKILQVALLKIFTDVVEFSVQAFQFFRRGILGRSFDQDIGAIIARLERHARTADQTAVATELLGAAKFRKDIERRQHEELKIQCNLWLKPSDVRHDHLHQVRARLDGTCNWIVSNDVFRKWIEPGCLTAQDRLLVISGTHGCGKSVLASSIVVRLENDEQPTLFFSFSSSGESRQTSENLIRTLLWQSLHEIGNKESVDIIQHLRLDGQPTVSELWEAFKSVNSSLAKSVYCIIDGIDECVDFDHMISIKIMHILETCPNFRILLLGRPHAIQAISDDLDFRAIEITSTLLIQDIEAFIYDEIAKSDILSLPELREIIIKTLKDKSDGMFLWVRLMVDDLKRSSSKSELKERLQSLPSGLEEAYQLLFLRLSRKLDKFELRLAQNVLALTVVACRPLRFDEIRYAYATHCRSLETVAQPLQNYLLLQPPQRILDICGGLVSIRDGFVRLIHSSVRDFLIRSEDRWVSKPDRAVLDFRIDITQTHRSFAWLCLDYLRLEEEEKKGMKPDTSQSIRSLQDSYPLIEYATLYTFYHLNRLGPPCSNTLAKIAKVFESTQSVFWVEHFAHFLLEDLGLDLQLNEFMAFQDRMADGGLDVGFFASFENNLEERISQMRESGKNDDPRIKQYEILLDLTKDGESETFSDSQSNEATESVREPSPAGLDLQARHSDIRLSSENPSATVSRIEDLLKGQTSLPVAHQIELLLRLQSSFRKTRVLMDPLKVLFQLILRKASGIPVYALVAIAGFYLKFEKPQQALEVYTVASKKIDHLNIPLKFQIQHKMGGCCLDLCMDREALRYYEIAFSGREILLGKRHCETINSLDCMIGINSDLRQYTEVLRLCDKMCMGLDFVPDVDIKTNLKTQRCRMSAYRYTGDDAKPAHLKQCLQATLNLYHESQSKGNGRTPLSLFNTGLCHDSMADYHTALEFFQLAFEAYNKVKGPNYYMTLQSQRLVATMYSRIGRRHEAKELLEKLYAEEQRVLSANHRETRLTKEVLDNPMFR